MSEYNHWDDDAEPEGEGGQAAPPSEVDELIRQADELLRLIDSPRLFGQSERLPDPRVVRDALVVTLRLARLSAMSLGECRMEVPYSTLKPVISNDGTMKWCCNHTPKSHCSS